MKITDYLKGLVRDFFIIFSLIVILITILRQFFSPDKYIQAKEIFIYMICALASDLTGLILYSPRGLSEKEMRFRVIIHFAVLEAVLLILANVMGWVASISTSAMLAVQIAVIYGAVRLLGWIDDRKAADKINERLKIVKDKPGYGSEE